MLDSGVAHLHTATRDVLCRFFFVKENRLRRDSSSKSEFADLLWPEPRQKGSSFQRWLLYILHNKRPGFGRNFICLHQRFFWKRLKQLIKLWMFEKTSITLTKWTESVCFVNLILNMRTNLLRWHILYTLNCNLYANEHGGTDINASSQDFWRTSP